MLGNKEIMAKNIRYYMSINNKERVDVCNDLGFSYNTFSDWVNAKKYPRIDKIEMMANYFGIGKADLVEDRLSEQFKARMFDEASITALYRQLNDEHKADVRKFIMFMLEKERSEKDTNAMATS